MVEDFVICVSTNPLPTSIRFAGYILTCWLWISAVISSKKKTPKDEIHLNPFKKQGNIQFASRSHCQCSVSNNKQRFLAVMIGPLGISMMEFLACDF
jgi:hypothetical protein